MALVEAVREKAIDFRNRVKPPEFGAHEIPCRTFLESLGPSDLANVRRVVSIVAELNRDFQNGQVTCDCDIVATDASVNNLQYGVIAVGSTTRPESKRAHAPKDIDLRIMSNTSCGYPRAASISLVMKALIGELQKSGIPYEEYGVTISRYQIETTDHRPIEWVNYDNNDPSFVVEPEKGLRLHVSISGMERPDVDAHLKEERRRGGHFSVLLNGETESRHLYWEPKAAHDNRIKKRITPKVSAVGVAGLKKLLEATLNTSDFDLLNYYQGLVEFTSAFAYGEYAFKDGTDSVIIDWDKPPQIDVPEYRYLTALSNIGESLRMGELDRTKQMLKGLTAVYGSRGESGGLPCNPEILYSIGVIKTCLDHFVEAGKLEATSAALRSNLDYQIVQIVNGYAAGDRLKVMQALMDFSALTEDFMKNKKVNPLRPSTALISSLS